MKQWDIFYYPFPSEAHPHYIVVISPDAVCAKEQFGYFNVACQTVRPIDRPARPNEVYLDRARIEEIRKKLRGIF